ncbi:MAG: LysR family transcriptional regulator [Bacteroidales bacterium]|nr:LysR family transcriptional regulator [Bacteroidales bacterium]
MDFRLMVFKKAAEKLSFTKTAEELYITQPAVTKHIKAIEQQFNVKLFNRKGNRIDLTEAGIILFKYAQEIQKLYSRMDFELSALNKMQIGKIRIGASTTIANYVLPQISAEFKSRFKDLAVSVIIGNTEQIESALQNNKIDIGIIEGYSKRREFHYTEFLKDEIVLTAKRTHSLTKKDEITLKELLKYPVIQREDGSGTSEVIAHELKKQNSSFKDFHIELQYGSTEGIKNYILHSESLAFLSVRSILKELKRNELAIIDVKNLEIKRNFNFIVTEGQQNEIVDLFIRFAAHYNF